MSVLSPHTERGAALVECAILLPVILLFLVNVVDLSLLIHDRQIASDAVRLGARVASFGTNAAAQCQSDDETFSTLPGKALLADNRPDDSIEVLSKRATYTYLSKAGLNPDDWHVQSSFPPALQFMSTDPDDITQPITVSARRIAKNCILCFSGGPENGARASVTFFLNARCEQGEGGS